MTCIYFVIVRVSREGSKVFISEAICSVFVCHNMPLGRDRVLKLLLLSLLLLLLLLFSYLDYCVMARGESLFH
jgi:hypothetical protein